MRDRPRRPPCRSVAPQTPEAAVGSRRKPTFILLALALAAPLLVVGSTSAATRHAPANRALPKLSGQAVIGKTLSASRGRWSNRPTRYRFTWLLCNASGKHCAHIRGAAAPKYRLPARAEGRRLRAAVRAANARGVAVPVEGRLVEDSGADAD